MTPFSLPYADGSTVSGGLYTDVVKFGGLLAMDQTFGAANNISAAYWLYNFETDGLLGLGFSETSALNASSVFDTLVSQGKIVDNVFSFRLRSAGAELMLGGVNTELYKEPFYYSPITNKVRYTLLEPSSFIEDVSRVTGKLTWILLPSMASKSLAKLQ